MYYKILKENGQYKDEKTGEDINIVECNQSLSPEGLLNVGWTSAKNIDDFLLKQSKTGTILSAKISVPTDTNQLEVLQSDTIPVEEILPQ